MTIMVRPLLPKRARSHEEVLSSPEAEPEARGIKRRCVSSACIPCRRRKSKCNGETPSCASCLTVYKSECTYDVDSDQRRAKPIKRRRTTPQQDNSRALHIIATSISAVTKVEAVEILQQLHRGEESLDSIADSIQQSSALSVLSDHKPLTDQAGSIGKPPGNPSGESRHYEHIVGLGLSSENMIPDQQSSQQSLPLGSWTTVTQDSDFIHHLIQLYFSWIHPFYVLLSEECLRHDMTTGRSKYCSPLLMNAILACACSYSDRPEARADPADSTTAGDHFFAEARHLLNQDDRTCLTTIQALAIMSLREASCARDSSGFQYMGRSVRMVLEMGMHLSYNAQSTNRLTPTEIEVRKITTWGCFVLDTLWAVCVGRVTQLRRSAINLEPTIKPPWNERPWRAYPKSPNPPAENLQGSHPYSLLQCLSSLSEIVNETVNVFYSPGECLTTSKFLEFNRRYDEWYKSLPPHLLLANCKRPHVIALHMYYHTLVLHLSRPFLKISSMDSNSPRKKCTEAAEAMSHLLETYKYHYTFRRSCVLSGHIALSASQIHLLNLPDPLASKYLTDSVRSLSDMGINHPFAHRCLRTIFSVAAEWRSKLPAEVEKLAAMHVYSPLDPLSPRMSDSFSSQQSHEIAADMVSIKQPSKSQQSHDVHDLFGPPLALQSIPLQVSSDIVSMSPEMIFPSASTSNSASNNTSTSMSTSTSNNWNQFNLARYDLIASNIPSLSPSGQHFWVPR